MLPPFISKIYGYCKGGCGAMSIFTLCGPCNFCLDVSPSCNGLQRRWRLCAFCLDVSPSCDLSRCITFVRFILMYHLHATTFDNLSRCIAFVWFILFMHEISVLYAGNVFLNIMPLFCRRSFEPLPKPGLKFFCVVTSVAKKPSCDIAG
jgi:hypothetical protein